MKIGVVSLGCVKNRVDTEQMLSLLTQAGHEFTTDPAQAEVLLVNTCGFIDPAKEESIQTILEMAQYKRTGRCKKLIVTGCLAQRYGDALLSDMPEIDALLGVNQYAQIVQAVEEAMQGERVDLRARSNQMLECGRVLTTPAYSAYVRIGEGCNNRCAYCAIPLIRGGYRSRDEQAILDEMRMLSQNGAKEQILISQDTSRYGSDCGGSLRGLIARAALVPGVEWLRVLYMYPDEIDEALLEEMARHDNVCKYLGSAAAARLAQRAAPHEPPRRYQRRQAPAAARAGDGLYPADDLYRGLPRRNAGGFPAADGLHARGAL